MLICIAIYILIGLIGDIALTDDAGLLIDITEFDEQQENDEKLVSLYPNGLSGKSFIDVTHHSKVWEVSLII